LPLKPPQVAKAKIEAINLLKKPLLLLETNNASQDVGNRS